MSWKINAICPFQRRAGPTDLEAWLTWLDLIECVTIPVLFPTIIEADFLCEFIGRRHNITAHSVDCSYGLLKPHGTNGHYCHIVYRTMCSFLLHVCCVNVSFPAMLCYRKSEGASFPSYHCVKTLSEVSLDFFPPPPLILVSFSSCLQFIVEQNLKTFTCIWNVNFSIRAVSALPIIIHMCTIRFDLKSDSTWFSWSGPSRKVACTDCVQTSALLASILAHDCQHAAIPRPLGWWGDIDRPSRPCHAPLAWLGMRFTPL